MLDEAISIRSLTNRGSRLGHQNSKARRQRRGGVALDPGTEIGSRMVMAIVVCGTELMVELKGGNEWRKGHQA